jgi:amino acid transporter
MHTDDPAQLKVPDTGEQQPLLRGHMGVIEIAFTVLAFSAPLTVAWGYLPIVILFGGIGAPISFFVTMILLLLFSVGFVKMSRGIPNPGAFYAFIAHGINRIWGLGSAYLASFAYLAILAGIHGFFGIVTGGLIESFGGPSIPWYVLAPILLVIVGVFGYIGIEFSAKVLTFFLAVEVLIVTIFDVAAFIHGGPEGRTLEPLTVGAFTSGQMGLGILFCVSMFIGFEATAIFREEARDPDKTIPRATYLSVVFIGLFYGITAWITIMAIGTGTVLDEAANAPADMFPGAFGALLGTVAKDIAAVFVLTSVFASTLATHNILSRYLFNLGVDKALPPFLGSVHPTQKSPYKASVVTSIATLIVLVAVVLIGIDPGIFYGRAAGIGAMSIMILMLLTSVAVLVHFRRSPDTEGTNTVWSTIVAPGLATLGLGGVIILTIANFNLFLGSTTVWSVVFLVVIALVFVAGAYAALRLKRTRPDIYVRLGRSKI